MVTGAPLEQKAGGARSSRGWRHGRTPLAKSPRTGKGDVTQAAGLDADLGRAQDSSLTAIRPSAPWISTTPVCSAHVASASVDEARGKQPRWGAMSQRPDCVSTARSPPPGTGPDAARLRREDPRRTGQVNWFCFTEKKKKLLDGQTFVINLSLP